jgi:hypothetical protein
MSARSIRPFLQLIFSVLSTITLVMVLLYPCEKLSILFLMTTLATLPFIFFKLTNQSSFCVCVSVAYFVQITSTRLQIQAGNMDGLIQFTQSYNISAINGINMLGWTVFYGLCSLALGLSFAAASPRVLYALPVLLTP